MADKLTFSHNNFTSFSVRGLQLYNFSIHASKSLTDVTGSFIMLFTELCFLFLEFNSFELDTLYITNPPQHAAQQQTSKSFFCVFVFFEFFSFKEKYAPTVLGLQCPEFLVAASIFRCVAAAGKNALCSLTYYF